MASRDRIARRGDRPPDRPARRDLRDAGASHADFSHARASRGRRSPAAMDAGGRHARASRCDRQCLRPLRGRASGTALPDAGLALRHRARCRQMGRAARADHRDFLRRRFAQARAAFAVCRRGHRVLPTRRASGSHRPCSAAARSPALSIESVLGVEGQRRHLDARRADAIRPRPRPYRRRGAGAPRTARLCRTSHRAGAGAGSRKPAGRRGDGDFGRHAAGRRA